MSLRTDLEAKALEAVCPCWFYDLRNEISTVNKQTLEGVVADPQYLHKLAQLHDPVPQEEYLKEIRECAV